MRGSKARDTDDGDRARFRGRGDVDRTAVRVAFVGGHFPMAVRNVERVLHKAAQI